MFGRTVSLTFVVMGLLSLPAQNGQGFSPFQTFGKEQPKVDLYGDPLPPGAVARFGTVRLRHIARAFSGAACVSFSADSKRLVSCADVGVRVWDVTTGKRLYGPFSKEDQKLMDRIVGKQIQRKDFEHPFAISPDGKIRVEGSGNWARLIDVASRKEFAKIRSPNPKDPRRLFNNTDDIFWFTFSQDSKILAAVGYDSLITWDAHKGKLLYDVKAKYGRLAFCHGGKYLACGGEGNIRLYDSVTGKKVRVFQPHYGFVRDLAFSPDDKLLASVQAYVVSLWDVASGKRLLNFPGNESPAQCLTFSPDGASLASGGDSCTGLLTVWEVATSKLRYCCSGHFPAVLSIAYSPDGKVLATGDGYGRGGTGGLDAQIRLWKATDGKLIRQWPGHINSVEMLSFGPGGFLASTGNDGRARLWDPATGKRLRQIRLKGGCIAFTADGKDLLLAGGEQAMWRTNWDQKIQLRFAKSKNRWIYWGGFLPGKTILSIEQQQNGLLSDQLEVCFWNLESGKMVRSFPVQGDSYSCFALSPAGKTLAISHSDIHLWDIDTGKIIARLSDHGDGVGALAFSPDGKLIKTLGHKHREGNCLATGIHQIPFRTGFRPWRQNFGCGGIRWCPGMGCKDSQKTAPFW